jgi:hypothetical protein
LTQQLNLYSEVVLIYKRIGKPKMIAPELLEELHEIVLRNYSVDLSPSEVLEVGETLTNFYKTLLTKKGDNHEKIEEESLVRTDPGKEKSN